MATNFPASLDSLTNPTSSDSLNSPSHSAQHANVNDAVEALQAKVGVDSSAVASSLDYKVAQLEAISHGKILQVVSTTKTDTFSASLASGNTVAVTGLSASLTCSDAANSVLVIVHLGMVSNATGSTACGALVTAGGTDILVGTSTGNRIPVGTAQYGSITGHLGANTTGLQVMGVYSPASTSAITYAVELYNYGAPTGNYYVNRSHTDSDTTGYPRSASSITLMEVAG